MGHFMRLSRLTLLPAVLLVAGCGSPSSNAPANSGGATPTTLAQNHVHSIVVMPSNPKVIYMGAHYHLYRSSDGGVKWHPLLKQMIVSMALDPAHPSTIYGVSNVHGLLKITDSGAHWTSLTGAIPHGQIIGVTVDPATNAILAHGLGIYRSTDGGKHFSWTLRTQSIGNVAVGSDHTLYAASGNGLYVSHDSGLHWSLIGSIGNQPTIQVVASGHAAYLIAAIGIFHSANDGRSWKPLNQAPQGIQYLGVSPTVPTEVFAEATGGTFYASHDGGRSWQPANKGIHDHNFSASTIRVAPSAPNVVYTGAWGLHFYASQDAGRNWTQTASLTQ